MLSSPERCEKFLILLLRLGGAAMLLAWGAALLPTSWMVASHRWLGLGAFPDAPLTQYLTRSISGLYGIHGGLLILLATDVRRFAPLIRYVAFTDIVFGALMLGVDLHAGMPLYWTLAEGPPIAGVGVALAVLVRGASAESAEPAARGPGRPVPLRVVKDRIDPGRRSTGR